PYGCAGLAVLLERRTLLDGDQRATALRRELAYCAHDLLNRVAPDGGAEPAAAEALEDGPQLGLEHDDERDEADRSHGVEEPLGGLHVELRRQEPQRRQPDEASEHVPRARPHQERVGLVEQNGDDEDVQRVLEPEPLEYRQLVRLRRWLPWRCPAASSRRGREPRSPARFALRRALASRGVYHGCDNDIIGRLVSISGGARPARDGTLLDHLERWPSWSMS